MSRRGRKSADDIDHDFFDDGPSNSNRSSNRNSRAKHDTDSHSQHDRNAGKSRSSRDSTDSESSARQSVKIAANVPRVDVEDDSDSSSNNEKSKEPTPGNSRDRGKSSDRSRSSSRSSGSQSRSASSRSRSTDSASTTDSSDAESDMTDVSPLHSPKAKNKAPSKKRVGINDTVYDMESKRPTTANRSRPVSGKSTASDGSAFERLMEADKDTLNLDLLMQAIMEMEEDRSQTHNKIVRQGIVPQGVQNPTSLNRRNMSFSNDRVKEIDKENQRLMRNILKYATEVKKQKKQSAKKIKPVVANHAPSAVNRTREQKRIEQENFALLKRLSSTKADPSLQREKQLDNFNNSKLYGVPMKAVHPTGDSLKSSSYSSLDAHHSTFQRSRPSSAKSVGVRPPSAKLSGSRPSSAKQAGSRPTSAKSDRPTSATYVERPLSGKRKPRPAWDERW